MLTSKASGPADAPVFGPSPWALFLRRSGPFLPASPVLRFGGLLVVLTVLVAAADWLLWQVRAPALSAAVLVVLLGSVAVFLEGQVWTQSRRPLFAFGVAVLGALPLIEVVNGLTGIMALSGCVAAALILTGLSLWRMPFAVVREYFDATATLVRGLASGGFDGASLGRQALNWIMPLTFGLVFLALFAWANPILEHWLLNLDRWAGRFDLDPDRVAFWMIMAFAMWPALALYRIGRNAPLVRPARPLWFFNAPSVVNALILFNALFALQTLTDVAYLWGGFDLPEGLTYAEYAHRGAYPLVATALLAGLFTILAYRWTTERPVIRWLLFLWTLQNVALVGSSLFRLDLYVDVYGLTVLRFSAFVWMGLVAAGLVILTAQLMWRRSVLWMLKSTALMAVLSLYGVSFINVPALVAQSQLDTVRGEAPDWRYICGLGEGAAAVLVDTPCRIEVSTPADWREWGYRNARIRGTLAAQERGARNGPYPDR